MERLGTAVLSTGPLYRLCSRTEVAETRQRFEIVARREEVVSERDGALSDTGNVLGTYLHGLFANGTLRRALLVDLAARRGVTADPRWETSTTAAEGYDRLADVVAGPATSWRSAPSSGSPLGTDLTARECQGFPDSRTSPA
jgi:hypothetical protein